MFRAAVILARLAVLSGLSLTLACGGCADGKKPGEDPECPAGETYNPINGECEIIGDAGSNNGSPDAGNNGVDPNNGEPDAGNNGVLPDADDPDFGPDADDRCAPGVDSDGDGLDNDCECALATSPLSADTDGDGLEDGAEDANGDCAFGVGETDPRQMDTDQDGADDAREIQEGTDPLNPDTDGDGIADGPELDTCLDPMAEDTDGDGLPDGVEDGNVDGMLGTCPNRTFDPQCAQGESDPCLADTDGDGTVDQDEAQYRACRPEDLLGLTDPQILTNMAADYQFVLETGVTADVVQGVDAHVFEDPANNYTGFVASLTPSGGETNPSRIADWVVGELQALYPTAVRRVAGRQITTHDNYKAAVGAVVDLPAGTALESARDAILGRLSGTTVTTTLTGAFPGDALEPTLFVYEILARSATQYVIAGALVTLPHYSDDAALSGIRVDDITGGTAIAGAMEGRADDCVSYAVTVKPKVDIIISIDGSGSMTDEQAALQNFAVDFTNLLTQSNLDWRAAVTRPDCADNSDLSADAQALFAGAQGCLNFPVVVPGFPGFGGKTGELVGGDFTADPMELERRLDPGTFSGGGEFTISALTAAADRATPRDDADPAKFRTDAAVILVAITDEEDSYFQDTLSWGNSQIQTLDATQSMELENETQPWIDFLLKPEIGATAFGIAWPPGEQCAPNGAAVAHAVAQISNETGGSTGSICQADITNTLTVIAEAAAGIASGLRLRGTPLAPTVSVVHGQAVSGNIVDMSRSRTDGFDYDSIVNRVSFTGPNPPQTNDRVVIPYRRWENSVFMCTTTADCPAEQKVKCVDGECR